MKTPVRILVKNREWQEVRKELLGNWVKSPTKNCRRLQEYLGDMKNEDKLRVVMNYLTGTPFRIGKLKHRCIQQLRNKVSKALQEIREKEQESKKLESFNVLKSNCILIDQVEWSESDYEHFIEKGSNSFSKFIKKFPEFDNQDFYIYVLQNNKANCDEKSIGNIAMHEIIRLASEFRRD